jgi:hypothetical protein
MPKSFKSTQIVKGRVLKQLAEEYHASMSFESLGYQATHLKRDKE